MRAGSILRASIASISLLLLAGCASRGGWGTSLPDLAPGTRVPADPDERRLWAAADQEERKLVSSPWLASEAEIRAYINQLTCSLERRYCGDLRPYVVERPGFGVFAAPNGMLLISTGSLLRFEREGQLAFALSHEIARYRRRHALQLLRFPRGYPERPSLATDPALQDAPGLSGDAGLRRFAEELEQEAVALAMEMVAAAGYDRAGVIAWAEQMEAEANVSGAARRTRRVAPPDEDLGAPAEAPPAGPTPRGTAAPPAAWERYRALVRPLRGRLLAAELQRRDPGATEVLLKRLMAHGEDLGELYYYQGELFRLRAGPGDLERAAESLENSLVNPGAPPIVYRSLGVVYSSLGDRLKAKEAFLAYLANTPDAQDAELIRAQLPKLEGVKP